VHRPYADQQAERGDDGRAGDTLRDRVGREGARAG
jgi:hypothetical protein